MNENIETLEMEEDGYFVKLYGDELTKKSYVTNPAIARDEEIKRLIMVLLKSYDWNCLIKVVKYI